MYILYMSDMTVSEARATLGPVTSRAEFGGEVTYVTKNGRRSAAIVSADAAELLERIEDEFDARAVRAALDELESGTADRVPFSRRTARTD